MIKDDDLARELHRGPGSRLVLFFTVFIHLLGTGLGIKRIKNGVRHLLPAFLRRQNEG